MDTCKLCGGKLLKGAVTSVANSWDVELRTKPNFGKKIGSLECVICQECKHVDFYVADLKNIDRL